MQFQIISSKFEFTVKPQDLDNKGLSSLPGLNNSLSFPEISTSKIGTAFSSSGGGGGGAGSWGLFNLNLKKEVFLYEKLLIKCIDILKRVLIVKTLYINICNFLLYQMVQIADTLQIQPNEIKTALILR